MFTILVLIFTALLALQETIEWKTNFMSEFKEILFHIFPILGVMVFIDIVLAFIIINQ